MKKLFVFALAAVAIVGCSKSENGEGAESIPSQAQQLKVLTSISTQTRTAVDGVVLPKGSDIGVHVVDATNESSVFVPSKKSDHSGFVGNYYSDGQNVRFENATGENTWTSTDTDGKTKLLLFSDNEAARVYGYYPYTETVTNVGANATVPVTIQNEGTITVGSENDPSTGSDNNADAFDDKLAYTAPEEIDYMYDATKDPNNKVGAQSTTVAKLTLAHALSRVSFRMYTAHDAKSNVSGDNATEYRFAGYVIKNISNQSELKAKVNQTNGATMKISNGDIEGAEVGGEISRTIVGYKMVRSTVNDDANNKVAADNSCRVSNLMFPHETLSSEDGKTTKIEVVFMIVPVDQDGQDVGTPTGYALPFAVKTGESDSWEAGKNYTYTVKFTGNALSIETVTVTDWVEVLGGDMEIE